jgi:hypothetical protein
VTEEYYRGVGEGGGEVLNEVSAHLVPGVSVNFRPKGLRGPISRVMKTKKHFVFLTTLDTGPRTPLSLELSDTTGTGLSDTTSSRLSDTTGKSTNLELHVYIYLYIYIHIYIYIYIYILYIKYNIYKQYEYV